MNEILNGLAHSSFFNIKKGKMMNNAKNYGGFRTETQKQTTTTRQPDDVIDVPGASTRPQGARTYTAFSGGFQSAFAINSGSQVTETVFAVIGEIFGVSDPNAGRRQWMTTQSGDTIAEVWTTTRTDKKELFFETIQIGVRNRNMLEAGMTYVTVIIEATEENQDWRIKTKEISYGDGTPIVKIDRHAVASDMIFGDIEFGRQTASVRKAIQASYSKKSPDGGTVSPPSEFMHVILPRSVTDNRSSVTFPMIIRNFVYKCIEVAESQLFLKAGVFTEAFKHDAFVDAKYRVTVSPDSPATNYRDNILGLPIPSHLTVSITTEKDNNQSSRNGPDDRFNEDETPPVKNARILVDFISTGEQTGPNGKIRGKANTPLMVVTGLESSDNVMKDPCVYMMTMIFAANALCDPENPWFMAAFRNSLISPTKGDPLYLEGLEVITPADPLVEVDGNGKPTNLVRKYGEFTYDSAMTVAQRTNFNFAGNDPYEITALRLYLEKNIRLDNIQFGIDVRYGTFDACENQLLLRIAMGWLARKSPNIVTQFNRDHIDGIISDGRLAEQEFHDILNEITDGEIGGYYSVEDTPVLSPEIGVTVFDNGVVKRDVSSPEIDLRNIVNFLGLANLTETSGLSKLTPDEVLVWARESLSSSPYSVTGDISRHTCNMLVNKAIGEGVIRDQRVFRVVINPELITAFLTYIREKNINMYVECRNADGSLESGLNRGRAVSVANINRGIGGAGIGSYRGTTGNARYVTQRGAYSQGQRGDYYQGR